MEDSTKKRLENWLKARGVKDIPSSETDLLKKTIGFVQDPTNFLELENLDYHIPGGYVTSDAVEDDQNGDNQGGDNQGGDNQGGDNQGGDNQGGDNQGGDNQGGDNQGGDNQGGDNQGGDNQGGDNQGGDNEGGSEIIVNNVSDPDEISALTPQEAANTTISANTQDAVNAINDDTYYANININGGE